MWREAWLGNPKDCTVTQLGMLFSFSLLCFCSDFTPFQMKKILQTLHLRGFSAHLSVHNYAQRKHKNSLTLWEGCRSRSTDFCIKTGTSDQQSKSTVAVKEGDPREEHNWAGFSLLLQLLEALEAGCGDDAGEGGWFLFPLIGNFSLQSQIWYRFDIDLLFSVFTLACY